MKTIVKTFNVYKYNELSIEAKEKVKEWLLSLRQGGLNQEIFNDQIDDFLCENFERSELKLQYSLNYSQGDGLNIYGELNLYDVLEVEEISKLFQGKKRKTIEFYLNYLDKIKIPYNYKGEYCTANNINLFINLTDSLESNSIRNINEPLIIEFENAIIKYFENLCKEYEKQGYEYFYEITEAEAEEECDCYDYDFLENGEVYF